MNGSLEHFCKEQTAALQELCLVRCAHMADALHYAYSLSSHLTNIITSTYGMVSICSIFHLHTLSAVSEDCTGAP